jgi:CHAT domain-containing protein
MRCRNVAVPLLLVALACASRADNQLEELYGAARQETRRGDVRRALALIERGETTAGRPSSEWGIKFHLLRVEVTLLRRDASGAADAIDLLGRLPQPDRPDAALHARQKYLEAHAHVLQGRLAEALDILTRARQVQLGASGDDVLLDIDALRGQLWLRTGRLQEAHELLGDVLQRASSRGDPYHQAVALHNLARGRSLHNRFDEALVYLERLLELPDIQDYTVYLSALSHAGTSYARLGQFDNAVSVQQRALERHEKAGVPLYLSTALGELGNTFVLQEQPRRGLEYLSRAFDVATGANLQADAAIWASNLAEAAADLGDFAQADKFNQEAIRLKRLARGNTLYNMLNAGQIALGRGRVAEAEKLYREIIDAKVTDPAAVWEAHAGLAKTALASGDRRAAARHFDDALDTIQQARSGLRKAEFRLTFLARVMRFYQDYVDTLVAADETNRALEVADSSRAVVLGERMGTAGIAPAAPSAARMVRAAGESGSVWLAYWLAPKKSYVWVVTGKRITCLTLPGAAQIEALVERYRAMVETSSVDPLATSGSPGDALYATLIAPAADLIPPGSAVRIVPDGVLHNLNFETLPVDGERRHYWIEDVRVAIAPSLGLLASNADRRRPGGAASLLLVGDPTPRLKEFPRLRYAPVEMTAVSKHFDAAKTERHDGDRATPAQFFTAKPQQFSVIHFTAHAAANPTSPLESAVILSGPAGQDKLYARDVAERTLGAELVTISACRSAGERTYAGEGLIGFAWAFLRAGARQVVAGLWDVDDHSTAALMDALYADVAKGTPVPDALRAAKLSLMNRGGHVAKPYYWAPFQVFTVHP